MGIQLATLVPGGDVDQRQVTYTCHLNVVRCLHEVCTGDRPVGDETRSVARLYAPRHLNSLGVADDRVGARFWRCIDAEIVYRVDYRWAVAEDSSVHFLAPKQITRRTEHVLTLGCLVGARSTLIGTALTLLTDRGSICRQVSRAISLPAREEGQHECNEGQRSG